MAEASVDLTAFTGIALDLKRDGSVTLCVVCTAFMPEAWHCIHFREGDPVSLDVFVQHSQMSPWEQKWIISIFVVFEFLYHSY